MTQHQADDETTNGQALTFFIETQLVDAHPGVVRLRELRHGTRRLLKRSHLLLYQLDREQGTAGEALARLIYEDQVASRQGKQKGPRWNFQQPCRVHLIQVIARPSVGAGLKWNAFKREIGEIHLPGGLLPQAVVARLAQAIDTGWQPPPDEAYRPPDEFEKGLSPIRDGNGLPTVVEFEHNYRRKRGVIVFIATNEEDDLSSEQYALLLLDEKSGRPFFGSYHLFSFEGMHPQLFLCDQGLHALTEPLLLLKGYDDWPCYWMHKDVPLRVEGGKPFATSEIRKAIEYAKSLFAEALPNYSVFCDVCHEEYRPALGAPVLQEASREGYVTTLCAHSWWCPQCQRWSTPAERIPSLATGGTCTHARPMGWESRLTNNAQDVSAPTPAPFDQAHEPPPTHPYFIAAHAHHWLPGQVYPPRHPGQYLTATRAAGEAPHEEQFAGQNALVLATLREDCVFDTTGGESDFVPKGTRLIGLLKREQPADDSQVALVVNQVTWTIGRDQVILVPLAEQLSQAEIAAEDEAEAGRLEEAEEITGAQACYARAIIEYEAAGWTELRLATLRMKRAALLLALRQETEAAPELDRAARVYEAQAYNPRNRAVSAHLEYTEQAVDALIPLGAIYVRRAPDAAVARNVIERLLSLDALNKKRYERKVDLLLFIADLFFALNEGEEAWSYFEKANRYYSQQLAFIADFPHVAPITAHLRKVKERLSAVPHPRKASDNNNIQ
jgi:hypothetical protein